MRRLAELRNRQYSKHPFYSSPAWLRVRYQALHRYGRRCLACGVEGPNAKIHVDHIKPRSRYPELSLDINNLQILCEACNLGKGAEDETDWRSFQLPLRIA